MAFERGRFIEVLDRNEILPSESLTNGKQYEILTVDKHGVLTILDDDNEAFKICADEFHAIKLVPTYKPSKSHPWKNAVSSTVAKWAKEKSDITNIQTVLVARNETLARKDSRKLEGGLI